jgi:hypothetical protein
MVHQRSSLPYFYSICIGGWVTVLQILLSLIDASLSFVQTMTKIFRQFSLLEKIHRH